jgi:hypothetical protein
MPNLENNLACVQADFQAYLTSPSYGAFDKLEQRMLTHTSNQYGLDATSRLAIYYDMYRLRLLDILFGDYPKLTGVMGEEKFTQAFLHYLLHHPSTHYSVRPFGAKLADFLGKYEPFCFQAYYTEMAKFEWALSLTFDAANAPRFEFERLKKLSSEEWVDLKFKLHPSVSILTFQYNIVSVWKVLENQKICPEQEDESVVERYPEEKPERLIERLSSPETWLIYRKDFASRFQALTSEQYFMLEAMGQGLSFSEVCEALSKIMPEEAVPGFVMHHLADWLNSEILY